MPQSFGQWEIWQVNWKHEDGTSKPRPALLLSPTSYNDSHPELVFIKISSKMHEVRYRIDLNVGDVSFAATGLDQACYMYPADVQRVQKKDVLYKRGHADPALIRRVHRVIGEATGYQYP